MKELLISYAAYNYWANKELTKKVLDLSVDLQQAAVKSSFSSLHKTIIHLWDAETAWWQRMKLKENVELPSLSFHPTTAEAVDGLIQQSKDWKEWVETASLLQLEHVFAYQTTKREIFKQPTWQMLMHVFNHSTFHRGQLVTIMRELGEEKFQQTDYIHYSRSRKN